MKEVERCCVFRNYFSYAYWVQVLSMASTVQGEPRLLRGISTLISDRTLHQLEHTPLFLIAATATCALVYISSRIETPKGSPEAMATRHLCTYIAYLGTVC